MQGLHHAHHVVEDDNGLALAQPLLLDDVVLQVDEVGRLVAEVVRAQAVQHQADPLLHLAQLVGLRVLGQFVGPVLRPPQGGGEETLSGRRHLRFGRATRGKRGKTRGEASSRDRIIRGRRPGVPTFLFFSRSENNNRFV